MGTKEQALEALVAANSVRAGRKELKQRLKGGDVVPHAMIAEPPQIIDTAKVGDVLTWVPKIGKVKARSITMKAGVSPTQRVGRLTSRQRDAIAARLP